jgi:hypothetical protein
MKNINKIVCLGFAISSCGREEVPPKTNGEKNAEELQKIINDNKDIDDFTIMVVGGGGGILTDVENIGFENHYMVYYDEPYFKAYHDLNNMLYFIFQYIDKDSRIIRIYF